MRQLAVSTAIVLTVLAAVLAAWHLRVALLVFLLSLMLAAAARPIVERLAEGGLSRRLGSLGTFLVGFGLLVLGAAAVGFLVLDELRQLSDDYVHVYERIAVHWHEGNWFQRGVAERLPPPEQLFAALTGQQGAAAVESLLGTAVELADAAVTVVLIVVLGIYWTTDRVRFERLWLSQLPVRVRTQGRDLWRTIEAELGAYVRSEILQSVLAALILAPGYWMLGMRDPVLLALLAAVFWMVPWVGILFAVLAVLALSPLAMVLDGLLVASFATGLAVLYTIVVLLLLEIFVEPRLFNRGRYNGLLMILAVVGLVDVFGLLGFFLGPPLAVGVQLLAESLLRSRLLPSSAEERPSPPSLQERLAELQQQLGGLDEPPPQLVSIVDRLASLVAVAEDVLPEPERPEPGHPASEGAARA